MPGNRQNFYKAMQAADRHRWNIHWEKAIREYQRALAEFPDDAKARMELGYCYMKMRQWQQALNEYEYVMKRDANNVDALSNAARLYLNLNRQEDAYNAYRRLTDLYTQAGHQSLADAARQKAKMLKPEEPPLPAWLEALRGATPPSPPPQQPPKQSLIDESALPEWMRTKAPDNPQPLIDMSALPEWLRARPPEPPQPLVDENALPPWLRAKPPEPPQPLVDENALPSWMRAKVPDNPQPPVDEHALPAWMEPENDDPLKQVVEMALASISTPWSLPENIRSQVLQFMKNVQKYAYYGLLTSATEECLRVIDMAPQYIEVHAVLSEIYVKQGRVELAVTKYAILVDTYVVNGRIDDAIAAYRRILQLQPDNLTYQARLNNLLAAQGKKEDVGREYTPDATPPPQQPGIISSEMLKALQALQAPPVPPPPEPMMEDEELQNLLSSTQLPADTILKERYRILTRLGKGGMGAVYKAKDTAFNDRFVAVKQMLQTGLAPQMLTVFSNNFKREANLLAGLMHHSLPRIYEYFSEGECWYLVMDYIEGVNLEKHLERAGGRLPVEEALRIGIELCTVLGYLHSRQPSIIFRDLKPTNVMIAPDGHLYLIDFGIARQFNPEQLKDTHHFVSAGYAAPEQYGLGQKQTTPQSDIYSLGATLHQMLSGNNPAETPFDFAPLQVGVPELETLVHKMLEISSINRPTSTEVVKQTLQRMLVQVQSSPKPVNPIANPGNVPSPPSPTPAQGRFGYLRIGAGKEAGREYELRKDEVTIGRAQERDIFIYDLAMSRLHAKVVNLGNERYAIKDEGSANGTKVNGQILSKYQTYVLQEGDRIQVGETVLIFAYR